MTGECLFFTKRFCTGLAFEWVFSSMNSYVLDEVALASEILFASAALKRPHDGVRPHMSR